MASDYSFALRYPFVKLPRISSITKRWYARSTAISLASFIRFIEACASYRKNSFILELVRPFRKVRPFLAVDVVKLQVDAPRGKRRISRVRRNGFSSAIAGDISRSRSLIFRRGVDRRQGRRYRRWIAVRGQYFRRQFANGPKFPRAISSVSQSCAISAGSDVASKKYHRRSW